MRVFSRQAACAAVMALLLCAVSSAPAKPAAKKPVSAAQREIQAIYNKISAALARKGIDTVYDYGTDDCEFYDVKGHLMDTGGGRQELIDLLENVDTFQRVSQITGFTGSDMEATVIVKNHTLQTVSNRARGRTVKLMTDDTYRDYWVKTEDGWRRKRSRELTGRFAVHKNF